MKVWRIRLYDMEDEHNFIIDELYSTQEKAVKRLRELERDNEILLVENKDYDIEELGVD